jgi:hypothetical protein
VGARCICRQAVAAGIALCGCLGRADDTNLQAIAFAHCSVRIELAFALCTGALGATPQRSAGNPGVHGLLLIEADAFLGLPNDPVEVENSGEKKPHEHEDGADAKVHDAHCVLCGGKIGKV